MSVVRPIARPLVSPLSGGSALPWEEGGGAGVVPFPTLTTQRARYRADLGITLVGSDVDGWADQSGVGNHLTAAAAGVRPLYQASAAAFKGQPVVEFDGVGEWLRDTAFSLGGAAKPFTVWLVMKALATTSGRAIWQYGSAVPPYSLTGANAIPELYGNGPVNSLGATSSLTTARLVTYSWDGTTQRVYVGTTAEDTDANANAGTADGGPFSLGAGTSAGVPSNIQIAEAGVMRAAITTTELAALKAYAFARYGV
jgi:hypothetical protein